MLATTQTVSDGHFSDGTRYGAAKVKIFADSRYGTIGSAFLDHAITSDLKKLVPGKRVLDIGCGAGNWCHTASQYGASTVHGFDIQEEMVKLAKKTTSHLDNVHIQVGDAANMPYDDALFDVALSFFVTCNLPPKAFTKHFQELYRVLAPGGKALLLIPTDWSHSRLYTRIEADPTTVEDNITKTLATIPKYPTTAQVTKAFKDTNDILVTCFAVDASGTLRILISSHMVSRYGEKLK